MNPPRSSAINLRPSTPEDVNAMFRVWHDAVRATHHFLSEADIAFYAAIVRDRYLPTAAFTVAVEGSGDGNVLGFLGMTGDKIDALFVHPAAHGRGIGRRLVDHARIGRNVVDVDVNEANTRACGFYQHLGFAVTGRSALDDQGRPMPLLHLRWTRASEARPVTFG